MTQSFPTVPLDGAPGMPLLGFGTWLMNGSECYEAVRTALDAGYRHIDTAAIYRNEAEVGRALRDSGVDRDEVFVTTKLPPPRADQADQVLAGSLDALGVDAVDLWLVHWPGDADLAGIWKAFTEAREQGLARDIGVSNFDADQIDAVERATGVRPAVNQIEWSPLLFDASVVQAHNDRGVVLEGYSALRGGTLTHPTIVEIAERLGRTPAQVIIRWHLEHGFVVIPKSERPDRVRANADVGGFSLSPDDVAALDSLGD